MSSDEARRPALRRELRFWLGLAGLFVLGVGGGLLAWAIAPTLHPRWEASVVTSGSMAPRIQVGDVVIWHTDVAPDVGPSTVIVFPDSGGHRTIHRIHEVLPDGRYVTCGDANVVPDTDPVCFEDVEGVGRVLVPLVGLPRVWLLQGRTGHLVALVLVLTVASWASVSAFDPEFDPWARRATGPAELVREPLWMDAASGELVAVDDAAEPLVSAELYQQLTRQAVAA